MRAGGDRMQDYYKKATLTIALDNTQGDHEGFLDQLRLLERQEI
jgi:hypothetical protein